MRKAIVVLAALCLVGALNLATAGAAEATVGSSTRPQYDGFWLTTATGKVSASGGARWLGDMGSARLNKPIVSVASTASGNGYWLGASDGGIFAFGDAAFFGSTGSIRLNQPIVGMAATPSGHGYWLVASDGGIFAFGDAAFFGSTGSIRLNQPIVGMAATPSGHGYWLVASDGGIFAFGDAAFFGSMGGKPLNAPVISILPTTTAAGYWMVASDGGVFSFGDAKFLGSINTDIVAVTRAANNGYSLITADGRIESRPGIPTATTTTVKPTTTTVAPTTTTSTTAKPAVNAKPSADNTGVPNGAVLTTYTGPTTITVDGTVIDGKAVFVDLKVAAKNVVIRNSYLHCGSAIPASNTGCVDANSDSNFNLLIENNTIIPDRPSYYRDGVVGHEYTARGNEIAHTNDGLGIFNKPGKTEPVNVLVENNYIHDLTRWNNDPAHTDGTHNDGIQVQGGTNIHIRNNNIIASVVAGDGLGTFGNHGNAAIMLGQNTSMFVNCVIEDNWLDDGQSTVVINQANYDHVTLTLRNNKFGRNQYKYANDSTYQIRIISKSKSTVEGLFTNTWLDTGLPLAEGRDLGIRYNEA